MADIPTAANLENYLVLAQNIELLVGPAASTGTHAATDTYATMRDVSLDINHPETRFNHGTTRSYGHGAPDLGIRFSLSVTQDIVDYLKTRGTADSKGVIPTYDYSIKFTPNSGTAKTIKLSGKMTEKSYVKSDGPQGNVVDANCFIRVLDASEPTAT